MSSKTQKGLGKKNIFFSGHMTHAKKERRWRCLTVQMKKVIFCDEVKKSKKQNEEDDDDDDDVTVTAF